MDLNLDAQLLNDISWGDGISYIILGLAVYITVRIINKYTR
jgi:hypothetical protein